MRSIVWVFRLLFVVLVAFSSASAFAAYNFVSIDCPGAANTSARGINNAGTVVLECFDADFNLLGISLYDSNKGTFTPIAPAPGFVETDLLGINEKGETVGLVFDGTNVLGAIRSEKGVYTTFLHPGSNDTEARANNNNGLVSGTYSDATGAEFGFLYDSKTNSFVTPGDLVPNSNATIAQGVNNQGQVVGGATYFDDGVVCPSCLAGQYGFMRDKSGAVTYFQVNGFQTAARGISDSGVITGFVVEISDNGPTFAGFVITLAASPQFQEPAVQLLMVPGSSSTLSFAIANDGTLAGAWTDADGINHGFIATRH